MVVEGVVRSLDCVVDRHHQSNTTPAPTARAATTTLTTLYLSPWIVNVYKTCHGQLHNHMLHTFTVHVTDVYL